MTRPIKFRAWDKEKKTMVLLDEPWICSEYSSLAFGSSQKEYQGICDWPQGSHELDGQIIMQYTGIKDAKGVEIYEGDILEGHDLKYRKEGGCPSIVKWDEEEACFVIYRGEVSSGYALSAEVRRSEVIGNIYENPELLKC